MRNTSFDVDGQENHIQLSVSGSQPVPDEVPIAEELLEKADEDHFTKVKRRVAMWLLVMPSLKPERSANKDIIEQREFGLRSSDFS